MKQTNAEVNQFGPTSNRGYEVLAISFSRIALGNEGEGEYIPSLLVLLSTVYYHSAHEIAEFVGVKLSPIYC